MSALDEIREYDPLALTESHYRTTLSFDPSLHPRNRVGEFAAVLGRMSRRTEVHMPGGVTVKKGIVGFTVHRPGQGARSAMSPDQAAKVAMNVHDNANPPEPRDHHFLIQGPRIASIVRASPGGERPSFEKHAVVRLRGGPHKWTVSEDHGNGYVTVYRHDGFTSQRRKVLARDLESFNRASPGGERGKHPAQPLVDKLAAADARVTERIKTAGSGSMRSTSAARAARDRHSRNLSDQFPEVGAAYREHRYSRSTEPFQIPDHLYTESAMTKREPRVPPAVAQQQQREPKPEDTLKPGWTAGRMQLSNSVKVERVTGTQRTIFVKDYSGWLRSEGSGTQLRQRSVTDEEMSRETGYGARQSPGGERDVVTYGVFTHSSGPSGGHVVRKMYDGHAAAPYSGMTPHRTFQREHAAQAHADKLSGRASSGGERLWTPNPAMMAVEVVPTDWKVEHGYGEWVPNIGFRSIPSRPIPGGMTDDEGLRMMHHYLTGSRDGWIGNGKGGKAQREEILRVATDRWVAKMKQDGWEFVPQSQVRSVPAVDALLDTSPERLAKEKLDRVTSQRRQARARVMGEDPTNGMYDAFGQVPMFHTSAQAMIRDGLAHPSTLIRGKAESAQKVIDMIHSGELRATPNDLGAALERINRASGTADREPLGVALEVIQGLALGRLPRNETKMRERLSRGSKAQALVDSGLADDLTDARAQLADMGEDILGMATPGGARGSDAKAAYEKGWRAGQSPSQAKVESADRRREHPHWYQGFFDAEAGKTKYESAPEHRASPGGERVPLSGPEGRRFRVYATRGDYVTHVLGKDRKDALKRFAEREGHPFAYSDGGLTAPDGTRYGAMSAFKESPREKLDRETRDLLRSPGGERSVPVRRYGNIPMEHTATLTWPDLLGGETEVIGPFSTGAEREAKIAALTSNLPGSAHPSVKRESRDLRASPGGERKRANGVVVWTGDRLEGLQRVANLHQAHEIDGYVVDPTTAALLIQVHDALSPGNRPQFASVSLPRLVDLAWKHAA